MKKKKKGPVALVSFGERKAPKTLFHENWQEMQPCWRVALLEVVEPFGWHKTSPDEVWQVRQRLANFESMTWKEILSQGGYRNHFIGRDRLCDDAKGRLVALGQDDIDSVMSLGVTQKGRVFGIMEHNVLKVLWWDPDHLVCPMEKPNT
jgi:hypothetical protein